MLGIEATHVKCGECLRLTEIADGETSAQTVCAHCQETLDEVGKPLDATCVTPVAVIPCPKGGDNARCDDPNHDPKSGNHIIEVD